MSEALLETGFSLSEQAHENQVDLSAVRDETEDAIASTKPTNETVTPLQKVQEIRQRVVDDFIGNEGSAEGPSVVTSPFERAHGEPFQLPLVYCDFTASHKPLHSVETYLQDKCLPFYGNTHTNTSLTGSQSTAFCSEARQIIGETCGAKTTGKASQDVVLFAGNGTTYAVQLLIDCLGLRHATAQSENERPVIFTGPYEHHSNLLPWRELGQVDMVSVRLRHGNVDLQHLEEVLKSYRHRSVKIGSFSAASNVTGVIADDLAITALLHKYGALSIWDYATGASYLDMEMNPNHPNYTSAEIAKDAIIFSGHKLLGGVGTPGVLVMKKRLVSQQNPPARSGGGTVFYVTEDHHRFLSNRIERYEGGTPNVVGIWRLGVALTAKQQLKKDLLKELSQSAENGQYLKLVDYEVTRSEQLRQRLTEIPNLVLMDDDGPSSDNSQDSPEKRNLPIFSFLIKCGSRFLHYNYVCAVLNDIFGIQSRGGCQCAGPFAQFLLGLTGKLNDAVEETLVHTKDELLRPGFTRLSLPTLGTTEEIDDYVIGAISWVAEHGWKLLHVYRCNHRTGDWRHKSRPGAPLGKKERKWLSHFRMNQPSRGLPAEARKRPPSLTEAVDIADMILDVAVNDHSSLMQALKMTHEESTSELSKLRWYVYPKEVASFLQEGENEVPGTTDLTRLEGAIRPIAWYKSPAQSVGIVAGQALGTAKSSSQPLAQHTLLPFREGDHTGTASTSEIRDGFDDGELTEACLIYNTVTDNWDPIEEYLATHGSSHPAASKLLEPEPALQHNYEDEGEEEKKSSSCAEDSVVLENKTGVHTNDVQHELFVDKKAADDRTTSSVAEPTMANDLATLDVTHIPKNEAKKPQRDSSQWGKGNVVAIKAEVETAEEPKQETKTKKKSRHKHTKPPAKLMRQVTQAMIQWDMLQEGDRLLLGLSGGKDSLSLLHVLLEFQKKLPINFEIEVCTIDPMTTSFDPSPLIPYVESLGLKYHYIKDDIVERANRAGKDGSIVSSLCSYCARMKRGNLYTCARTNNCNKLVLAQHLDDLAESFMMSVMHNGFLRTMKANYKINAGDLSVIRPLAYCRESLMTDFAKSSNFPIINENCPACFEEPKERARIKKLLSREETLYPNFYDNIKRSLLPLMHDDATAILRSYTEEALAKSRKDNKGKGRKGKAEESERSKRVEIAPTVSIDKKFELASDEELVMELARRRAAKHRLAGAMKRTNDDDPSGEDPTGQFCTLNGGNGSIPCRELME